MTRTISIVLAVGLVILWLAGLSRHATPWLTWLDVVAALCAFAIAATASANLSRSATVGEPIALAVGLGILFVVGLTTHAVRWLTWWTFVFACAFMLLGLGEATETRRVDRPRPV